MTSTTTPADVRALADKVVRRVCDYDDRTSPEDWPEALLITGEELHAELMRFAEDLAALSPPPEQGEGLREWLRKDAALIGSAIHLDSPLRAVIAGRLRALAEALTPPPSSADCGGGWRETVRAGVAIAAEFGRLADVDNITDLIVRGLVGPVRSAPTQKGDQP